jgi:hypothetical protein
MPACDMQITAGLLWTPLSPNAASLDASLDSLYEQIMKVKPADQIPAVVGLPRGEADAASPAAPAVEGETVAQLRDELETLRQQLASTNVPLPLRQFSMI